MAVNAFEALLGSPYSFLQPRRRYPNFSDVDLARPFQFMCGPCHRKWSPTAFCQGSFAAFRVGSLSAFCEALGISGACSRLLLIAMSVGACTSPLDDGRPPLNNDESVRKLLLSSRNLGYVRKRFLFRLVELPGMSSASLAKSYPTCSDAGCIRYIDVKSKFTIARFRLRFFGVCFWGEITHRIEVPAQ